MTMAPLNTKRCEQSMEACDHWDNEYGPVAPAHDCGYCKLKIWHDHKTCKDFKCMQCQLGIPHDKSRCAKMNEKLPDQSASKGGMSNDGECLEKSADDKLAQAEDDMQEKDGNPSKKAKHNSEEKMQDPPAQNVNERREEKMEEGSPHPPQRWRTRAMKKHTQVFHLRTLKM